MAKHAFISAHKTRFSIRSMCRVLNVSSSWFHARSRTQEQREAKAERDLDLVGQIRRVIKESRNCYGPLRVFHKLIREGVDCTSYLIRKLMILHDIRLPRRRKWVPRTTDSNHSHRIAPNLLDRQFSVFQPNKVWLTDITYVPTDEGWLYLAAVKDMATREIVGWSMDDHLKSTLCENALNMAIQNRKPPKGLIHHSDRGVQYACADYRKILKWHRMKASMSRKGNCWDNAVAESFFATIKRELVNRHFWVKQETLRAAVYKYIEVFYNRKRKHSTIGNISPDNYENSCMEESDEAA